MISNFIKHLVFQLGIDNKEVCVRGAPWSAANRLHGQRTGAFSWRPVLGLSRKTDQFRLDHTQNCAPGWWCDRESSVYHLALEMYSGIFRHATNPLALSRMPTKHQLHPAPIQPTIAMTTTHIHQLWLTRPPSTRSHSASEDHPQAPVVTQQQQQQQRSILAALILNCVNEKVAFAAMNSFVCCPMFTVCRWCQVDIT